jgi:DNA-binding MarR family transcriptional regulator
MSDFEFRDTPALEVLRKFPETLAHIDPADIAAAQDLLRLAKKLLGSFSEKFALHGLSPGRYAVLMALYARKSSLAPSEIADRLRVTRATVTGLLSGLVHDDLVAYVAADEADRRRKAISLTAKGRDLLGNVVPDIFIQMAGLLAPLSRDERITLLQLTKKVENGLSRATVRDAEQEHDHGDHR